jgi:hypothetical protein
MGLAGSPATALAEPAATGGAESSGVAAGGIDSLLNQYSGLTPGDSGGADPTTQSVSTNQQFSTFTGSAGAMVAYYTTLGVDRTSPNDPMVPAGTIGSTSNSNSVIAGSGSDLLAGSASAAPSVAALTVAHAAPDSLVGAVAAGNIPMSSRGSMSAPVSQASEQLPPPPPPPTPAPLPAAVVLLGSGLAALVPLRKRTRKDLVQVA